MPSKSLLRSPSPRSTRNRIVGFFPGLGSRSAYQNLGRNLLDSGFPSVAALYQEAAQALGFPEQPEKLLLLPENIPEGTLERQGFIGAAFLVHSLALEAHLRAAAERRNVPMAFMAYTGESFGIIAAAVSSGAISCSDGVKIAQAFTPLMMLAAEGGNVEGPFAETIASYLPDSLRGKRLVPEPFHVVALKGDKEEIVRALECIERHLKIDVQVHKFYSWQQTNVYVRAGAKPSFDLFLKNFPAVTTEELKEPTTFLAHSGRMRDVRSALERFIDSNRIAFQDPRIPVISNHGTGFLTTAEEIRDGILAITDQIMRSQTTVEILDSLSPDIVLELGLGNKSVQLLIDNGMDAPVMSYSGIQEETDLFLRTVKLVDDLQGEMAKLHARESQLEGWHYDMLRELFQLASTGPSYERYLYRTMINVITDEMLRPKRDRSHAFYRFLEIFQHTYRHRSSIDVDRGELIVQARMKKAIFGHQEDLGHVYAELKVLNATGDVADTRFLGSIQSSEVVVLHFERLASLGLSDLAKNTRLLLNTQPLACDIYDRLQRKLQFGSDGYLALEGSNVFTVQQIATSQISYQYALFRLLALYRPAIFAQRDYYVEGSDPMGWLVALAVAQACSLPDAIRLYGIYLQSGPGSQALKTALDELCAALRMPVVPVISPDGILLQSRKGLEAATQAVFLQGGLREDICRIQLSANCHVVSLGSLLAPARINAGSHETNIVSVLSPADIWRKLANPALDELEELCISTLTDDNEKVLRYAQSRRLLSSTIYAYVNMGERIIGFGKGGSESMTIFLAKEAEDRIVVRKILSEALTAARWDPDGEGVMLPPFAKAKKQAEYLQALPVPVRPFFPEVYEVQERDIPIPAHLRKDGQTVHKELIYEMSYFPGEEVSRFVEKHSPPPAVIARLYEQIYLFLKHNVHSHHRVSAPGRTLDVSYFKKIEDRLALCRRTAPRSFGKELLDSEQIVINGISYFNLLSIVQRFRKHPEFLDILEPRFHCLVMGDTNTENIKITHTEPLLRAQRLIEESATLAQIDAALEDITAESLGIRFLDPRAIGFETEGGDTSDDPMYDNKPWHNCLGHYDEIHYEHFKLQVHTGEGQTPRIDIAFNEHNPFKKAYRVRDVEEKGLKLDSKASPQGMEDYFSPLMTSVYGRGDPQSQELQDDPYWLIRFVFIMGTHFAAMPPFHFVTELDGTLTDTYQVQRRPVAIYCEGVKWLNWALQMLEGKRKEFLGVPVPALPYRPAHDTDQEPSWLVASAV